MWSYVAQDAHPPRLRLRLRLRLQIRTLVGEYHGLAVTLTHGGLQWQTAAWIQVEYQEGISGRIRGGEEAALAACGKVMMEGAGERRQVVGGRCSER
jgi:hypothetical protein